MYRADSKCQGLLLIIGHRCPNSLIIGALLRTQRDPSIQEDLAGSQVSRSVDNIVERTQSIGHVAMEWCLTRTICAITATAITREDRLVAEVEVEVEAQEDITPRSLQAEAGINATVDTGTSLWTVVAKTTTVIGGNTTIVDLLGGFTDLQKVVEKHSDSR